MAQRDLLITQAGEEIRCRILDETPSRFVYAYIGKNNKVLRSEIFKNLVTSFKYNYYDKDLVSSKELPGSKGSSTKVERVDTRRGSESKKDKKKKSGKGTSSGDIRNPMTSFDPVVDKEITKEAKEVEVPPKETQMNVEEKALVKESESSDIESNKKELSDRQEPVIEPANLENSELLKEPEIQNEYRNYLKFRVGVKGGLSNAINIGEESTNSYDLYREQLLRGWNFGGDFAYFFTEGFGAGVLYNSFRSSNSSDNLTYPNLITDTQVDNGTISTRITQHYVGPVLYFRKGLDYKTFVILGLSGGMNFYNETGTYNQDNYTFTGMRPGGNATLGVDFLLGNDLIGRDIILTLEAGYNYSRFNELDFGGTKGLTSLPQVLNLDRLDFSVGLRFLRFPRYLKMSSN